MKSTHGSELSWRKDRTSGGPVERGAALAHEAAEALLPGSQLALFSGSGLFALCALLAFGVWTDRHLLTLFCALILATAMVAWVWASLSRLALQCRLSLSAMKAFPGDKVVLSMKLENCKPLPVGWTSLELRLPGILAPAALADAAAPGGQGRVGFSTSLGWFESATWQCSLLCRRRGYHRIGPPRMLCGDGFGLYLFARHSRQSLSLLIYPRLYELEDLGLPSRQPLGEARDPSLLFEDASRLRGLRGYTAETPFKQIAWSASARGAGLYAKTFEPRASLQTVISLAVDHFDHGGDPALFELAISATASLARQLMAQRQPVGLLCNGKLADGTGPVVLGAGRGNGQLECLLESLAKLGRNAALPFERLLTRSADALSGGTTLCVIVERLPEADLHRLMMLRQRGCSVTVLMVGSQPMPEGWITCRRIDASVLKDFCP